MKMQNQILKPPLSLPPRALAQTTGKEKLNPVSAVEETRRPEREDNGKAFPVQRYDDPVEQRVHIDKSLNLRAQKALLLYASYQAIPAENTAYVLHGLDIYV